MSSLSSAINSLAAVSVEDYCRVAGKTLSPESTLQVAKYVGMFWGLLTLGLSFVVDDIAPTIIEAINKIGSVCYGPILATFFLGVCTKHLSAKQVNTGLIAGVLLNIYLWLAQPDVFWFWWNVIGFSTALGVSLGVYWLSHKKVKQPFINTRQDVLTKTNIAALITWCVVLIGICIALPVMLSQ